MAVNYQLGGWYMNPATGKNQRWWNGVWTNGEDPTGGNANFNKPTSQPAPTSQPSQTNTNQFNVANTTQSSASPQSQEQQLIAAMTAKGHTPESAKGAIAGRGYTDLAREYLGAGSTTTTGSVMPQQTTLNLPSLYDSLYSQSGIKDIESQYSNMEKQFIEAKSKINDNPFLSEATRVGRIAKLEQLFNERTANIKNDIATKKADIDMKLNLQTKQFDIQNQATQNAISQFNSLLSAGALDNATPQDIANITNSTGISSDMIQSAVNNRKLANQSTEIKTFDDGVNEGFIIFTIDQSGNVVNETKKVTGKSSKGSTFDVNDFLNKIVNAKGNSGTTTTQTQGDISTLWDTTT